MMSSDLIKIPSIGIWNDSTNAHIGSIDLNKIDPHITLTYEGYQHVGSQTSTYNYASKELSFVAIKTATNTKYLITVNTQTWKEVTNSSLSESQIYTGLAYDGTTDLINLFGTYSNGDGNVYVCKISPNDHKYKPLHNFAGKVCTTVFETKSKIYYVIFTKPDNIIDIFVNAYDINGVPVSVDQHYTTANVGQGFKVVGVPYNISYIEKINKIVCNIDVQSSTRKGPELFYMTPGNKVFTNSGWNGNDALLNQFQVPLAIFPDHSLPRIYQIAKVNPNGDYKLYVYSTYNNRWTETKSFKVPVTSIWQLN